MLLAPTQRHDANGSDVVPEDVATIRLESDVPVGADRLKDQVV